MKIPIERDQGFSLIEVIVALGILSTAVLSLSSLARGSIAGVKQLESHYLARTIADAKLVETFSQVTPMEIGVVQGELVQMGRSFAWERTIEHTDRAGILSIDVLVSEVNSGTLMAQITTLRGRR